MLLFLYFAAQKPELPLRSSRIYEKYGSSSNCNSAFTWFLRGIMKQLKLGDHSLRTLYVLAEVNEIIILITYLINKDLE